MHIEIGDRVTHAYTGNWTGTVTDIRRRRRNTNVRVSVKWDGGDGLVRHHDADLIRKVIESGPQC